MAMASKPPADVRVESSIVRALLREQHAGLADLPLVDAGEGWDNRLFRLGDDLAVRLPRRAASAALIGHEQRWLPELAPRLPLPVPVPRRIGVPGCGFPWPWSITTWFPGETALQAPPHDLERAAVDLARFLRALHEPAPPEAPHNPWRGVPLSHRTAALHQHLHDLDGVVDRARALEVWTDALETRPWPGPPVWIHGDLHPGNLLVQHDRLVAVIDFGDLTAGDPAVDLAVAWTFLPGALRPAFRAAAGGAFGPIDEATWTRARGWALALGLAFLVRSEGDTAFGALAVATVNAVLSEAAER
jgi:aminoglycoside phosphotransferase (APT) family kinase protein